MTSGRSLTTFAVSSFASLHPNSSKNKNLIIIMPKGSGTNSQGNHYNTPGGSNSNSGSSYHYSNTNGSYYYSNDNGSSYYNSGSGYSSYTPSGGKK